MKAQAERTEDKRPGPWAFVVRLFVVLAAVVAVVLLVKRATAPERQLQAVLDAEAEALNLADWRAFQALQDFEDSGFRRYQKSSFDSFLLARQRGEGVTVPSRKVVEVDRQGDSAWALVMEDPDGDPAAAVAAGPVPGAARIEFFRRAYGEWLHTGPDPDHWGPPQESQTGQITWRYREADAGQVARLATFAEAFTQQVCDDIGLHAEERRLVINLCYSSACGVILDYPPVGELDLPTPLLFGYDDESLETLLAHLLAGLLFQRAAGADQEIPPGGWALLTGVKRWEVAQVQGEAWDGSERLTLKQAVAAGTLLTLEELDGQLGFDNLTLVYGQAYTLVEYIVAQHGRQALSALVRAAGQAPYWATYAEMLQEALGADLDLAAFEEGWLAFVRERYGD